LASKVEWNTVKNDLFEWAVEVLIEGMSANFATHFLLGVDFTIFTIIAHGIVIKQGLSIYWRLKEHGTASKIPKKD